MAAIAEELVVRITADYARLQSGMKEAAASVKTSSDEIAASAATSADAWRAEAIANTKASAAAKDHVTASGLVIRGNNEVQLSERALAEQRAISQVGMDKYLASSAAAAAASAEASGALQVHAEFTDEDTAATTANTGATLENAGAQELLSSRLTKGSVVREYNALLDEVLQRRYTYMAGTTSSLAGKLGLMSLAFSGVGAAVIGVVAALGSVVFAMFKGEEETTKFQQAFYATGGAIGVTYSQFEKMGEALADSNTSIGHARAALMEVAQTGQFTGDQLQKVARGALDMADSTGVSVKRAVQDFVALQKSPVEAAEKLNETLNFLTPSIFAEIQALQKQGKVEEAAAVAEDALSKAFANRASSVQENLGYLQKAADATGHMFSRMWDDMMGWGKAETADQKLKDIDSELKQLRASANSAGMTDLQDAQNAMIQSRIAALEKEKKAIQDKEAAAEKAAQSAASEKTTNVDTIKKMSKGGDSSAMKQQIEQENEAAQEARQHAQEMAAIKSKEYDLELKLGKTTADKVLAQREELENSLYETELRSYQQQQKIVGQEPEKYKELTDKIEVLELQHQERLLQIKQQAFAQLGTLKAAPTGGLGGGEAQKALQQQLAVFNTEAQAARQHASDMYDIKAAQVEQAKALGKISATDAISEEEDASNETYQIQLASLQRQLQLIGQTPEKIAEINGQIEQLEQRHQLKMIQYGTQYANAVKREWLGIMSPISQAIDTSVQGMVLHTTTAHMAMRRLGRSVLEEFIADETHKVEETIASQMAQTAVVATSSATRTSITTAATKETTMAELASAAKIILAHAWTAAAAVYQSVADIPFVGWILAPALAIATAVEVASFAGRLMSAEGGWWQVPQDSVTNIHKNEMVLPAEHAERLRSALTTGSGIAGGGGGNSLHIHTMDSSTILHTLKRNPRAVKAAIHQGIKNHSYV